MREAFNIIGKILTGTATESDRRRLEHLCADQSRSMKKRSDIRHNNNLKADQRYRRRGI